MPPRSLLVVRKCSLTEHFFWQRRRLQSDREAESFVLRQIAEQLILLHPPLPQPPKRLQSMGGGRLTIETRDLLLDAANYDVVEPVVDPGPILRASPDLIVRAAAVLTEGAAPSKKRKAPQQDRVKPAIAECYPDGTDGVSSKAVHRAVADKLKPAGKKPKLAVPSLTTIKRVLGRRK